MKRFFDLLISINLLLILLPLLGLLSLVILLVNGRPVLFKQKRLGINHKPFNIIKFCTMNNNRNIQGLLLPDKDRITALGSFLRRTSLDEIPSLWNVILNDMSLIGPRPLHARYLTRYSKNQKRRHEVKPGITGWAQVNGRNAITWEKRLSLDVWYVDNRSIFLDLKVLVMTIAIVFSRRNIDSSENQTMEEFMGNLKK